VAADIDLATARETSELLAGSGEAAQVDVRDPASVERLIRSLTGSGRRIDILANVAGVLTISPVIDLPVQDWDRVMAVNARGVFLMSRAVLPSMIDSGGGAIVNMSSAAGKDGSPPPRTIPRRSSRSSGSRSRWQERLPSSAYG
jgi:NAD(P)-dependent dehydrogenase (short-subunit alcohol dehydrogenase family)